MNSKKPNKIEKIRTKTTLLNFKKKEKINVGIAKNIARKLGIKIKAIGIRKIKLESNVRDIVIQYKLEIK